MKIAFATMENFENRAEGSVGSSMIRARWLIKHWPEAEEYKIGYEYDAIIFQKVYWKDMFANFQGIKILDICDPDWLDGKPVFEYVEMADAVVTSTPALADYIQKMAPGKKVICIPDRVDLDSCPRLKFTHQGDLKRVVWFGYHQNFHYVEPCLDEFTRLGIKLTIIADMPFTVPMGYVGAEVENIKYEQKSVMALLSRYDAALLPQVSDVDIRGHFKSNNKDTQCWALGLPVIKLPTDLDAFKDPEVRKAEAEEKRKLVEKEYDVKLSVDEYQELIKTILGSKLAATMDKEIKEGDGTGVSNAIKS